MSTEKREYNLVVRYLDKPTRKNAIYAMCFHCFGGNKDEMPDSGYQRGIGNCTSEECPLYAYRPYQKQEQ